MHFGNEPWYNRFMPKADKTPEDVTNITLDLVSWNEDDDMFLSVGETGTWDGTCGTTVDIKTLKDGTYSVVRGHKRYSVEINVKKKQVHITRTK